MSSVDFFLILLGKKKTKKMFNALKLNAKGFQFASSQQIFSFDDALLPIKNKTVILSNFEKWHLLRNRPKFLCKTLILNQCEQNIFPFFPRYMFPNVVTAIFGCDITDKYVLIEICEKTEMLCDMVHASAMSVYEDENKCKQCITEAARYKLITKQSFEKTLNTYQAEHVQYF